MPIGYLQIHFHFAACTSLKEKRGIIKPIIAGLQREFGAAAAEMGYQDVWKDTLIGCAFVSNDARHLQQVMQAALADCENRWPNISLVDHTLEVIPTQS